MLRLVRGLPLPAPGPPRVVAVDDWAIRKGRTYGTIVVGLERRRAIDLLPDRTSTTVADRWHLLANARDMLERWLARAHARLRHLPVPPGGDGCCLGQRTRAFRASRAEAAAGADSRARWLAAYEDVRRPRRSILDPFIAHLEARMAEGCEDAMALWREVRGRGYAHGPKVVQKWVAENRTKPATRTPRKWLQGAPASAAPDSTSGPGPALPSPKQLAWLLVRPVAALSPLDAAAVRRTEQDKEAAQVASLARRLTALVRGCGAGQPTHPATPLADLNAWLAEARASGVSAVETFAAGLEQDGAAVRAALTEPWSSGQAEGQINRIKMLKRQSYGRAGLDLMRRRGLMAA